MAESYGLTPQQHAEVGRVVRRFGGAERRGRRQRRRGGGGGSVDIASAFLNGALLSGDGTATIDGFVSIVGATPASLPTTVQNDNSLAGDDNDPVIVAKRGGEWVLTTIIEGPAGPSGSSDRDICAVAVLTADLDTGDATTASFNNFRGLNDDATPTPATLSNSNGLEGVSGSYVLLREASAGTWTIVLVIGAGGTTDGCWVISDVTAATESAGTVTASTCTVKVDQISGATRTPGTSGETAYWSHLTAEYPVPTGKAYRGLVARTSAGTLELIAVYCGLYDAP